ncbi:DNA topoisomerase 2-binding protein 1-like [Uloborus diversus]|uniref:DNA topoisomerase 2-binding protein 1-like n=1 Tax=Uloborus diversus TaxID=327109 RepID=UPI00240962A6|nr:DNA topoisomerase 2-binding protein 1-like [Uloborus diversus]
MSISFKDSSSKYEICFVQTGSSPEEATQLLKLAFEAMETNQLEPLWITVEACMKISQKEPKLFIMDPFHNEVFDHLKSIQCRIIGPLCILYCLQYGDVLPKRPYPVYSVSMRKITVSCSNIVNEVREDMKQKIELMGGFFSKDLTKSVTHLVVGGVGSKKYQVAANFGLPIMVPDWISDVWENGQYQQLHATDGCYDKYKCPVFKGLVITVSQISAQERLSMKSIIENNGGSYSGALKSQVTTHLVLSEPTGDKYRFAKSWKIFCVKVNWIYDSVESGYCRDESLYALGDAFQQPKRSTPKKDSTNELPLVDCSAIVNNSIVTHLDESVRADTSGSSCTKKDSEYSTLDSFNVSKLQKGGQYLDGCKIFLAGFTDEHMKKLRKIINAGGGVQFSSCAENVSHIVCNGLSEELTDILKSFPIKPYVVSFKWLLECCSEGRLIDESPFLCLDLTFSQENELTTKKDHERILLLNTESKPLENSMKKNEEQVIQPVEQNITKILTEPEKHVVEPQEDENEKAQRHEEVDCVPEDIEDDEVMNTEELFKGMKFIIVGFLEKDTEILSTLIETHSGIVLSVLDESRCNIAVVPVIWQQTNLPVSQIVTNCWLQKCIEDCRVFDFDENELFRPFFIPDEAKPFESFVISVSQYSGTERDCLMHLAEVLGATCQEYFVRKANKTKGVLANTHLVVATPEGSKYEASKKWKIPAVTKYWVLDAAKTGTLPMIDDYLVDACNAEPSNRSNIEQKPTSMVEQKIEEYKNVKHVAEENHELSLQHDRITELIDQHKLEEASTSTPQARQKLDISLNSTLNCETPRGYKFQVSGLLKDLDCSSTSNDNFSFNKRHSLPVEEMFSKNLASALKHINDKSDAPQESESSGKKNANKMSSGENVEKVLCGVVLCVARKLCYLQSEINEIVASLGGDYLWSYDKTCTHFVFSGKPNDTTKEFREARAQGKIIVSPEWVYSCQEKNEHVAESLFPHTFKSELTLKDQLAILKTPVSNKNIAKITETNEKKTESPGQATPVDFNRLNELLVAAKSAKKRQTKRMANSVSSSPVSEISPMQKYPRHLSDVFLKPDEVFPEEQDTCSQQSQSYPITWDDPTGRLEREKIAARLTNNGQTAEVDPLLQGNIVLAEIKNNDFSLNSPSNFNQNDADDFKMPSKIKLKAKKRIFMFSNISEAYKNNFTRIIRKLGGDVSDIKAFDVNATHLVVAVPIKNEKFMSSVAAGKWVIHPDYFEACEKQDCFLDESEFEWGGPSSERFIESLAPNSAKIAFCPAKWRAKLNKGDGWKGAFQEWKVVIVAEDKAKLLTYTKVLEAGSAEVFSSDSMESCLNRLTHVIVEFRKKKSLKLDLSSILSHNIKCVVPEYLASFLTEDPPSDIENFLIPEVKELTILSEVAPKRRNLSSTSRQSKKSKLK